MPLWRLERLLGIGCATESPGVMSISLNGDYAGFVQERPSEVAGITVGLGPPCPIEGLAESFRMATRALETAIALNLTGIHDLRSLGLRAAIVADRDIGEELSRRYLSLLFYNSLLQRERCGHHELGTRVLGMRRRAQSPPRARPTPTANSGRRAGFPSSSPSTSPPTLDNWDPRIIDPIAEQHHVIAFDNRGVGASTGTVPDTVESMADDAYTFITALGFDTVDICSFSLGGMVAQALVIKHPELLRKLILTGTGPAGGKGIDKVAGTTYYDTLRATLTRVDPKEFLFFNRDDIGKRAASAFVERLEERTEDRDMPITVKAFRTQLKAIKRWGR
jgi:hypothetical protein